ncbi:DUF6326 family protein [Tenacibaculum agarivorans]|uniref:DUF6326 family protein n=1 Tax=Tenacibaculum agarivorans TaxID=1908389 RepID=UPI00094B9C2C|nr:DUF6326 family protein [Tenacibaculum agarivorans]
MSHKNIKIYFILLWITVLINMIFADIFSIIVELVKGDVLAIPGEVTSIMAIAALVTNIPILMIFLSWILPGTINKLANTFVPILTSIYIIGGRSELPHYYIIASIEIVLLILIIFKARRWKLNV